MPVKHRADKRRFSAEAIEHFRDAELRQRAGISTAEEREAFLDAGAAMRAALRWPAWKMDPLMVFVDDPAPPPTADRYTQSAIEAREAREALLAAAGLDEVPIDDDEDDDNDD